jgi:hypothetical protein
MICRSVLTSYVPVISVFVVEITARTAIQSICIKDIIFWVDYSALPKGGETRNVYVISLHLRVR